MHLSGHWPLIKHNVKGYLIDYDIKHFQKKISMQLKVWKWFSRIYNLGIPNIMELCYTYKSELKQLITILQTW